MTLASRWDEAEVSQPVRGMARLVQVGHDEVSASCSAGLACRLAVSHRTDGQAEEACEHACINRLMFVAILAQEIGPEDGKEFHMVAGAEFRIH